MSFFDRNRYRPPMRTIGVDVRAAQIPESVLKRARGVRCKAKWGAKGRMNGFPIIQGVAVSAPSETDPKKSPPSREAGIGKLLELNGR
jgi:hypothetical protein